MMFGILAVPEFLDERGFLNVVGILKCLEYLDCPGCLQWLECPACRECLDCLGTLEIRCGLNCLGCFGLLEIHEIIDFRKFRNKFQVQKLRATWAQSACASPMT